MRKINSTKIIAAIFLSVFAVSASAVQTDDGKNLTNKQNQLVTNASSYIVVLEAKPLAAYEGEITGLSATKPGRGEKLNPNSAAALAYAEYLQTMHVAVAGAAGIAQSQILNNYKYALNGFSAIMTSDQAARLANQSGVLKVVPDEMQYPHTDNSPGFLQLDTGAGPWATGHDGEGVVIGVIDSGIWPEHPSFADDGSYPAPPGTIGVCDFGDSVHNPMDVPFTCNNKLIGAHQTLATYRSVIGAESTEYDSARDDNGHGTHTASTAGGNAGVEASIFGIPRGTVSGIAPRAHIVAYKGLGKLGGFSSDLVAAINQAVADGVDVINYSVGGGASLNDPTDIAFLFAADAGVFVATSAGNSGPGSATIGSPGTVPWITTLGASTQNRTFLGSAVVNGFDHPGASITSGVGPAPLVDAEPLGNELCNPAVPFSSPITGKIVLCQRGTFARVEKSRAVFDAGGSGMILYNTSNSQDQFTDSHFLPSVHINNTDGLNIKSYISSAGPGATATIEGGVFTNIPAPGVASFSSRGSNPVAPDLIKPDVTAPGVSVLAGNSPTPDTGAPGELFSAISGTSMSSPHVAGAFALMRQAHQDWSPAMAKSALMTTATQNVKKEDGTTPADPFDMGAGHISPGGSTSSRTAFDPGLVYDAGYNEYAGFLCGAGLGSALPPGACTSLDPGTPTDASDLNLPSIGIGELSGSQTVVRTVTSVAREVPEFFIIPGSPPGSGVTVAPFSDPVRTFNASVDAPPGFDVQVAPSTLHLAPGQSASFDVTIKNVSAPIGDWAFGSLTWSDMSEEYNVRSPIAAKPSLFWAPVEIHASGASGGTNFNVNFGYTGSYVASAHGLEPATISSDNVVQDPDQTFDQSDGFSKLHQFNLSGDDFFRIALPPDATEPNADLDIFVFDPTNTLVASSLNGGTDELVDISLPMDGSWSVYVHGWSTPGGDSDYDLYSWVISATPGGNLIKNSAPASATIGTTGIVNTSWTGATAGQWHLGAVSHTGDAGLMDLTLIQVDNR